MQYPTLSITLEMGYTLTTDAKGYGRATIPLSHRDTITLTDLHIGSSYEVSEDYQDYQQSVSGKQSYLFRYPYQDIHVVFTNKKDGLIPTGIIMNNGSTLLLIGSGIVILIYAKAYRRKERINENQKFNWQFISHSTCGSRSSCASICSRRL